METTVETHKQTVGVLETYASTGAKNRGHSCPPDEVGRMKSNKFGGNCVMRHFPPQIDGNESERYC